MIPGSLFRAWVLSQYIVNTVYMNLHKQGQKNSEDWAEPLKEEKRRGKIDYCLASTRAGQREAGLTCSWKDLECLRERGSWDVFPRQMAESVFLEDGREPSGWDKFLVMPLLVVLSNPKAL